MIRTEVVDLTVISAVAYRQKLPSGGSGVTILRYDSKQPGIASISKTSGEAIPAKNTPPDLFPAEAFEEAIRLTAGMPYKKSGAVRLTKKTVKEAPAEPEPELEAEEAALSSDEYQKIVDAYTDKSGKVSYDLLNKDLIRFAHASSKVRAWIEKKKDVGMIRNYIITTKFGNIAGNRRFTEAQALKVAELLEEVSPKSAFKELNEELRRKAAARKKQ